MKENEIDYKKLYEEEHKKYECALGRARGHHSVASHYNNADEIQELEHIFPELKEREDEKIRKDIIFILANTDLSKVSTPFSEMLNWLEKQKEQKSTDKNDFDRGYEVGISAAKFNQWKPTKEQMEALCDLTYSNELKSLYEDLKKL